MREENSLSVEIKELTVVCFLSQNQLNSAMYGEAVEKFFACTDADMAEKRAIEEANRPIDPKTLVK